MVSRAVERIIFERDKHTCQICGRTTEFRDGDIDHKIPKSKGGSNNSDNLEWACHSCNILKSDKRTNEEVRKLLTLPENFDELMSLRNEKEVKMKEPETEMELPNLSQDELDAPSMAKCIKSLQESYQNEAIIDEICNTITAVKALDKTFVHIGMHYKLPRLWFLPYTITGQSYCNDYLFMQLGREIAIAEQNYFIKSVVESPVTKVDVIFSPQGILEAVDVLRSRGYEPTILSLPSKSVGDLFDWQGTAHLEFTKKFYTLVLDGKTKLKIIFSRDKESILLEENAVGWQVKRNPQGALYVVLGNHQLYPLKYVELLTGISVKSIVNAQEALNINFKE